MAVRSIFDSLVAELSAEERRDLLERIKRSTPVSEEPLYGPSALPRAESTDYSSRVADLGFLGRLLLFLRGLFTGKAREEILREDDLKEIARRIEGVFPGLVDRRHGLLLGAMAEELRRLRDSARFFYEVLDRSVEKDKAAFFAFLGSIELPELHHRLLEGTDPSRVAFDGPRVPESELRALVLGAFDMAFAELPDSGRRAMYQDVRSILFLKRLSGFLFERLMSVFREGLGSDGKEAASFSEVRDLLLDLADILFSMVEPPSVSLMEALFVFVEREEIGRPGGDPESLLGADLVKAEKALGSIRLFNGRVPFVDILRLITGDPAYAPRELAGGEDWLALYKSFWKERMEGLLDEWKIERRYRELAEEAAIFVGEPGPGGFAHISRTGGETSPPVRLDVALIFLDAFYRGPFLKELNRPFKLILVDGEFYRKDNRLEFTDAFDGLLHIPDGLASLDARLGPEGDLGGSWIQAATEIGPLAMKRHRMRSLTRNAEDEAERLIRKAGLSLTIMGMVLKGILKGEAGGRYDSLANLSYLDGKANKDFVRSLGLAKDRCEKALALLTELSGLDLGAME